MKFGYFFMKLSKYSYLLEKSIGVSGLIGVTTEMTSTGSTESSSILQIIESQSSWSESVSQQSKTSPLDPSSEPKSLRKEGIVNDAISW
jgi:hypothetical protein